MAVRRRVTLSEKDSNGTRLLNSPMKTNDLKTGYKT